MKVLRRNKSTIILYAIMTIVFAIMIACTIGGEDGVFKLLKLKAVTQQLAMQNRELLRNNVELVFEIQDLKNPAAVERVARETLGLVYAGETVFVKNTNR